MITPKSIGAVIGIVLLLLFPWFIGIPFPGS